MSHPYQPTRRRSWMPWIIGGLVVLFLCGGFVAVGALAGGDESTGTAPAVGDTGSVEKTTAPAPADFKLTAKIVELKCYGEAGCAVTWKPEVTYSGPAIADGQTWLVSYKVSGVESGTKVGTILIGPAGPAKQGEKHARVVAEDSQITLKVTGVQQD